jgi:hypothetical protein
MTPGLTEILARATGMAQLDCRLTCESSRASINLMLMLGSHQLVHQSYRGRKPHAALDFAVFWA